MLSNHDSFAGARLWDQLGGNAAQYRLAAATYLLQPGTPFVYYGEEIGMAGASANIGDDPKLRTPMSWAGDAKAGFTTGTPFRALSANAASNNVAAQSADPNSLLSFYKAVIAVRRAHPSLTAGTHAGASASGTTLSFQRVQGNERAVVMINYGGATANVAAAGLPANAALVNAFPASGTNTAADAGGNATVSVPAQSVRVFVIGG
jgi:glycosidase